MEKEIESESNRPLLCLFLFLTDPAIGIREGISSWLVKTRTTKWRVQISL